MSNHIYKNGFVQIPNRIVLDGKLSFKARGILVLMMSRPPNWNFNVKELTSRSDKDGVDSVRKGLKELINRGYIELRSIYNSSTKKLEGTRYFLKEHLKRYRDTDFPKVEKVEVQKTRGSQIQTAEKVEVLEMPRHNNTDYSNKEYNKTHQQQKPKTKKIELAAAVFTISSFEEELLEDNEWQESFIGQSIGEGVFLKKDQMIILLAHFIKSALQSEKEYYNIKDVKKHFANWFNLHDSKRNLQLFVNQGKQELVKRADRIQVIRNEVALMLTTIKGRTCKDVQIVLTYKGLLQRHQKSLVNLSRGGLEPTIQTAINNELPIIADYIDVLNRGESKNQLAWFCEHYNNSS